MEFVVKAKRYRNSLRIIFPKCVVAALAIGENTTFGLNFAKSGDKIFVTGTIVA